MKEKTSSSFLKKRTKKLLLIASRFMSANAMLHLIMQLPHPALSPAVFLLRFHPASFIPSGVA
jgi:hypothetical protein